MAAYSEYYIDVTLNNNKEKVIEQINYKKENLTLMSD